MATDLPGFTEQEVLNKVLNTTSESFKVDIVSGSEYAEDSQHTDLDTGQFVLGVRNDVLAALGLTDGDYVPFQMNASGALFVDVADGGQLDTIIDTLETTLTAIETDQAAIEVLLTAANVDHAANEALLITIDEDTNAIKGHVDGIETLITSTNSKIDTLDAVQDNALTKLGEIETTNNANQVLLGTIDSDTNETKTALNNMLYGTAVAITAVDGGSNQDIESGATYEALYIGVGGDVTVTLATDTEDILFKNLASGQLLPIRLTDVKASNTTATHMIALKA